MINSSLTKIVTTVVCKSLFALFLLFGSTLVSATDLMITIVDIDSNKGKIYLSVCDKVNFLKKSDENPDCTYTTGLKADPKGVTFTVNNVIPNTYAIKVFHDENNNGKLDKNFIGIPSEGFGLSDFKKTLFGAPEFEPHSFTITGKEKVITKVIRIIY